jgi:hypothetical protein
MKQVAADDFLLSTGAVEGWFDFLIGVSWFQCTMSVFLGPFALCCDQPPLPPEHLRRVLLHTKRFIIMSDA